MKTREIAKRYAKALLALTKQKKIHEKALLELIAVKEAFASDASIQNYFENPSVLPDQKIAALKNALTGKNISEEVINTLLLLTEKSRLSCLDDLVQVFSELLDEEGGLTRGVVRSAKALSQEAKKELENKIQKILNKKIVLTYQEDTKLLGGIVAQVGGWTFDDSVEAHLNKLNEELNRRAN